MSILEKKTMKVRETIKFDEGKPCMSDVPQLSLMSVAKVFNYGANKYSKFNYSHGTNWLRYYDAAQRHLNAWMIGEDIDELSKTHEFEAIKANAKTALLNSFVGRWGSLKLKRNLIHFLLKYRYEENWKREVRENYLPVTVEDFLKRLRKPQYRISYFRHIQYYHFTDCVKEDFGIEIQEATHLKIILNRK
jgi:hypothetical protein